MHSESEPTLVGDPFFREQDVGVIKVTYPEPANITLREYFTNVHPDFGNKVFSRYHVYDDWPESVPMFFLECTREVSSSEVSKKLRELKSGAAAYEEMLGYYKWWREPGHQESWMADTIALGSVMLGTKHELLVPGMAKNPNWFNLPDLGLCLEKRLWPPKTRFLGIHGRGFEP